MIKFAVYGDYLHIKVLLEGHTSKDAILAIKSLEYEHIILKRKTWGVTLASTKAFYDRDSKAFFTGLSPLAKGHRGNSSIEGETRGGASSRAPPPQKGLFQPL